MITISTGCNNKATRLDIGKHHVFISYETIIGYQGPLGACRVENSWGPTTGKHISWHGIRDYPIVSREELNAKIDQIGQ